RDVRRRGPGVAAARPRRGSDPLMAPRPRPRPRSGHAAPARARAQSPAALDLRVRIGPLRLANPVLTGSGTYGYGEEYAHVQDPARLGAVVTKTVTLEPRVGNPPVRIAETAGGMLNTIGLENVGLAV